jgi:hypothetical protein
MVRHLRDRDFYVWHNAPGSNIELPDDVCGQYGFHACFSPSGDRLFVVGNEVMPQEVIEEKIDPVHMMTALRNSFYVSHAPEFKDFERICYNDDPSIVYDMACSPTSHNSVAFIASTVRLTLPKTPEELYVATNNPSVSVKSQSDFHQALKDGARESLFLLDASNGEVKELTCIRDKLPMKSMFLCKGSRFLCWTPDGESILYNDRNFVWSLRLSGEKTQIFSLKGGAIFSNIRCEPNGDLQFVFWGPIEEEDKYSEVTLEKLSPRLLRIDSSGKLLSKTGASFYPGTYEFEDAVTALIGKDHIACIKMVPAASLDSTLNIFSIDGIGRNETDPTPLKKCSLRDRNRLLFYYQPLSFSPDGKAVYVVKKRAVRGDHVTPLNINNAHAPWCEFRKIEL